MNQAQVRLPSIIEEGVTTNPELKRSIDYIDRSVKKIKRGGQGGKSRSSRKRSSKSRNLRRKSIKRHRRRTSRK